MTDIERVARAMEEARFRLTIAGNDIEERVARAVERRWKRLVPEAQAAITAINTRPQEAGAGWRTVQVEPTEAMIDAARGLCMYFSGQMGRSGNWSLGQHASSGGYGEGYEHLLTAEERGATHFPKAHQASLIYRAMIAASPPQPAMAGTDRVVAEWITAHGYATGHGDTIGDMLDTLEAQVREHATREAAVVGTGLREGDLADLHSWLADNIPFGVGSPDEPWAKRILAALTPAPSLATHAQAEACMADEALTLHNLTGIFHTAAHPPGTGPYGFATWATWDQIKDHPQLYADMQRGVEAVVAALGAWPEYQREPSLLHPELADETLRRFIAMKDRAQSAESLLDEAVKALERIAALPMESRSRLVSASEAIQIARETAASLRTRAGGEHG